MFAGHGVREKNSQRVGFFVGPQVGLFRKSGVKSRIQALRQQCELSPDSVGYEDQSAYDVADMVKQFFRDLPEPLLTSKLGETFLHIYQCEWPRRRGSSSKSNCYGLTVAQSCSFNITRQRVKLRQLDQFCSLVATTGPAASTLPTVLR